MHMEAKRTVPGAACRCGIVLLFCLGLVGCPRPVQPPAPAPGVPAHPAQPAPLPSEEGTTLYEVDPSASVVHIHVFRGGAFARLGHNHVVSSRSVSGRVWLRRQFARSGFELSFPVVDLIVDDPEARRAAGSDFPPEIPEADKQGTRRNMLRKEVLDAQNHPTVTVKSASISGSVDAPTIKASITLKDATRDVEVPARIEISDAQLSARGEFYIKQTDFGMKPFSVGLGALVVQDQLLVRFELTAVRH
jgi:hypothetical protein